MGKTWFFKTLLFNLSILLAVGAFLLILLFYFLMKQNEDEMKHVSAQYAIQVMQTVDSKLQLIDQEVLKELVTSSELNNFLANGAKDQFYVNYLTVQEILRMKESYSLIDSIYLVHPKQDYVVSTSTIQSLRQYGDYSFIKNIRDQVSPVIWSNARCFLEFTNKGCTDVVSLVRKYPSPSADGIYVVVNISTNSINRLIESFYDFKLHEIQISDRSGKTFLSSKKDISRQTTDFKIVMSTVISPYTGWTVASGSENQKVVSAAKMLTNIWMIIGLILVVFGSVVMIFSTRKQYKPIQNIFLRISSVPFFGSNQHLSGKNDLKLIESALNLMIEKSSQFQLLLEEDSHLRKRQFFHDLIEGTRIITQDEWQENEIRLQVPKLLKYQWSVIVEIDRFHHFSESYSLRDQNLLRFTLIQVFKEIVESYEGTIWSDWISPNQFCSMIQFNTSQADSLEELVKRFHNWSNHNLKFSITIGVGEQADSIGAISESYKEAKIAIQFKATIGVANVISYNEVQKMDNRKYFHDFYGRLQLLAQSIWIQDEEWKEKFFEAFLKMKECRISRDDVARLLLYFISQFEHQEPVKLHDHPLEYQIRLDKMKVQIEQYEEIEQLQNQFYLELSELYKHINADRLQGKHYHLIREIKAYIEEHFTDSNLSLELLNDKYGIGVKNLSKLFKDEFGVNFIDYVTELRIEQAKTFLIETDKTVQEIAEEVAYSGAVAFGRVFKRVVGVSPSTYRERMRLETRKHINSG
ncbi:helix-turn-helix domain-containing protein [Paenibacillus alginolyticus]|uniref:helix-turn-helix domain-containing protein n=1 Tax=Paenibacillus alginolyticus TaxID=59839 RepID=UPI00041497EE|nr:helix-turn-helix domain-containing protein [Paenibacillus alginolyticus]MCY9669994.1 helix-turn-helix domain-containing protein [Paenibacillus alginolyticus]